MPNAITPDLRGLGAPLSEDEVQATRQQEEEAKAAAKKPAPPPIPYRVDRTGLNTSNLPPPPTRAAKPSEAEVQSPATKPKPRLPPRLPPRQNSNPGETTPAPPPPYSVAIEQDQPQPPQPSFLNQAAASRLGGAGIKVPGLGIGGSSSPPPAAPPQAQSPSIASNQAPNNSWRDQPSSSSSPSTISGLTNRFGSLRTAATNSPGPSAISQPPPPLSASPSGGGGGGGTTLAQKQAALKTAQSFRNDPGSVSMADARATASTAKNFNDRHGEQVASGWKAGTKLNQKYGIADKVGGYAGQSQSPTAAEGARESGGTGGAGGGGSFGSAAAALGGFKKAPPPPPPAARSNTGGSMASPPPVPLGSKPR